MHLIPVETLSAGSWIPYPRCSVSRNVDIFPVHRRAKPNCSRANKSPATFSHPLSGDHLRETPKLADWVRSKVLRYTL